MLTFFPFFLQCLLGKTRLFPNSVYVGSWPYDLAHPRCPPGLQPKCVFAHPCVKKGEEKTESAITHPHSLLSSSSLHLFRHPSNLSDGRRWHGAACCGNHRQAVRAPLDLRPLRLHQVWGSLWCEKGICTFPGPFVIDAWCTVPSGSLGGSRTHCNVNIVLVLVTSCLAKVPLVKKFFWLFC